jgi:hypothetical protein
MVEMVQMDHGSTGRFIEYQEMVQMWLRKQVGITY